ncbi:hypothetical protein V8G54_025632 [Vigna mungo]|uniref:F-box domain-containing protein n=1 Tax=Vigna mungo TaxID=3915 RepID=A0AAQ3MYS4_VIGMU
MTQKLHNHLPDDLAFSILFKLPLKSLKRFGSLCKSWAILFENSLFVDLFCINFISNLHSFYDDISVILCFQESYREINRKSSLFLLSGESFQNVDKLNWLDPLEIRLSYLNIVSSSSVNGILCFVVDKNRSGYLWNPAIGELKAIPHSPIEYLPFHVFPIMRYLGFGYDCIRDDYKVIRSMQPDTRADRDYTEWDYTPLCESYSLRSNSWRKVKIDVNILKDYGIDGNFYLDGMCHWLSQIDGDVCLISFDMSSETYYTTPTPIDIPLDICNDFDIDHAMRYVFLLNGSIALMSNYEYSTTFYISILTELDKKETWNKLFTLGPLPLITRPIGARSMGNILFETNDGALVWYDLNTHKITKVDLKVSNGEFFMVIYKKSLVQIERRNN